MPTSTLTARSLCAGACWLTLCTIALAEDWPWFLGPRHDGISGETAIQLNWPDAGPNVLWKQPIGTGYSAPSVLGDRLVVHHRQDDKESVSCRSVSDGNVLWEDEQYSSGVFGYTANELLVRSRNDISIRVLDVETGKVIRKFECPPNIGIGLQTKDGYFYVWQKRGGRIVRYREGDTDVDLVFDCRTNGEVFGKIRRVPRVTLLYVDEHKCIFTVESRLGIMDLATRKIKAPDQPPLQAYKMLHSIVIAGYYLDNLEW